MKRLHLITFALLALFISGYPISESASTINAQEETGTICVNAFHDEDANGLHEPTEGYMASVTFTVASESEVVGQAIASGNATPQCFENLVPGIYQVAQEIPGALEMTTAGNTSIEVEAGKTKGIEFGSRIRLSATEAGSESQGNSMEPTTVAAEETAVDNEGASSNLTSIAGLIVIVLAVILLGVVIFTLLRRS